MSFLCVCFHLFFAFFKSFFFISLFLCFLSSFFLTFGGVVCLFVYFCFVWLVSSFPPFFSNGCFVFFKGDWSFVCFNLGCMQTCDSTFISPPFLIFLFCCLIFFVLSLFVLSLLACLFVVFSLSCLSFVFVF